MGAVVEKHPSTIFTRKEMLAFLDFFDEIADEAERDLPLKSPDPYQRMITYLMRRHLQALLTTVTNLAEASGVPYATAMRRISEMIEQGLIIQRPRTKTGKSFSLHPSPQLIQAWYNYALRMKCIVGRTIAFNGLNDNDYYYDVAEEQESRIIPVLSVLREPLTIKPELSVLMHADPTFMAMDKLKRQFEQVFGTPIRNYARSIDQLRREALSNAVCERSAYDIIAADLPWIGEFAEKGVLMPLDEVVKRQGIKASDFHEASWKGCFYQGKQWGVPIQTTPELLFYRTDILEEAGIDPPRTTDEVVDAIRRLHKPHCGRFGIAWNAARGTPLGHTFIMTMAAFGQSVLDLRPQGDGFDATDLEGERLRPRIDSEAGRQTAEYLRALHEFSPPKILSMSWQDRVAAYGSGEVAMAYNYSLLAPYFELDKSMSAHGNTGFLPHPSGPSGKPIAPVGGYVLGIPQNIPEERRQAVEQSLKFFTSAEACKLYMLNGSLVSPRFSVSADPEVRELSPIVKAVDGFARSNLLQYWPRPPAPEIADVITICGEELHDMLRGVKSIQQALSEAQNRSDALMRANNRY